MNTRDPKIIALLFNECINQGNLTGLADLMSADHTFIDRNDGKSSPKEVMVKGWREFFKQFPEYKNTFTRIESTDDRMAIIGSAYWSKERPYDPVLWSARIENDLVAEWRVLEDTSENRRLLNLK